MNTISASHNITLIEARNGKQSIKISCEDGTVKALHSLYNPVNEAKSIVDAFRFDGKGILVVLGLGLGYHIVELSQKYPEAEIMVIEAVPEIRDLAREHGPEIDSRVRLITGLPADAALRKVTEYQIQRGMVPLSLFPLSSAVSAFNDYYRPVLENLGKSVSIKLWEKLKYEKFRRNELNVLLIDTGYFLIREVEKSLNALGHQVAKVQVSEDESGETIMSCLIGEILNSKPDFMLMINHLGFDEEGVFTSFFESIEMPVASWFVDSPNLIVKAFGNNVSPYVSLFLWDKSYMHDMNSMGFDSVDYLPLGTDETVFRPYTSRKHRKKVNQYICKAGFVGNSMIDPVKEWKEKVKEELQPAMEKLARRMADSTGSTISFKEILSQEEKAIINGLDKREKMDFEAAVLWKATLLYRLSCLEMIHSYRLMPSLHYYRELPFFYNACDINFNATSLQMSTAVNQRVFDVPACGAFLLTDDQDELQDLFRVGEEIVTYKEKGQIPELVKYYLAHEEERNNIAMCGRERVLKDHTYRKRLNLLTESMKKRYG
jgi:spore maturation protein CgeB